MGVKGFAVRLDTLKTPFYDPAQLRFGNGIPFAEPGNWREVFTDRDLVADIATGRSVFHFTFWDLTPTQSPGAVSTGLFRPAEHH